MKRAFAAAACAIALGAAPALADAPAPAWMIGASGGSSAREGDATRGYGSLALTRKLGTGYVRASVTRFGSAVVQVDVRLPSTYTIGFVSAGRTFGWWFVDGYGALGVQHYRPVVTDLGPRAVRGDTASAVWGAGADGGYVYWLDSRWALTPSASIQFIRSRALRERIGPAGPGEFETRETGATFGATLRLDRFFGHDRADSAGMRLTRYATDNASAALVSGTRGAAPGTQGASRSDGWTEAGANLTLRLRADLYLDGAMTRTFGAEAGDVTTTALGARLLF